MNKYKTTRYIVKTVVSLSAAGVIKAQLETTKPDKDEASNIEKATYWLGALVIGSLVGHHAGEYVADGLGNLFGEPTPLTSSDTQDES